MGMNLASIVTESAARDADAPAIRLGDRTLTYGELADGAARVATLLREHGVQPGDRVGVMLPNVPEFASVYYGILRAGAVVVPMNPLLKEREVAYYLDDAQAGLVFAWPGCADPASVGAQRAGATCVLVDAGFGPRLDAVSPMAGAVARIDADTAVLLYTSGTTGQPKGAELTHANLRTNVEVFATDLVSVGPDDVIFGGLPLFHSFGQTCGLNAAVSVGACLTLVPRFVADTPCWRCWSATG